MTSLSRVALAAALSLLAVSPALAADNYTIQSGGASRTIKAKDIGGILAPQSIAIDGTGAERFTDANPATVKLPSGQVVVLGAGSAAIGSVTVTNGATSALQTSGNASLTSIDTKSPTLVSGRVPVDGSAVTQPVSGAVTVSGVATAAKQPAFGVAGTSASDVLSVQGITGGTPQATDTVVRSTSVDRGGTITAGGSAQQFMPANANRRGFTVQNQSTADLYVNCVATAAANQSSLRIPAGALYESSPHHSGTGACSVFGATSAQAFYAREF